MSCLLRELYNHLLVVLVSIPMCLLFLCIWVVSGQYLTLSVLIIVGTSLLLRCLLSDMYTSIFNVVIMLSPLISRMLIYTFLLLSIIMSFMIHLAKYAISFESSFGLATAPRILLPSLNLSCSFTDAKGALLLSI